ncbi:hypothetical protein SAMD00019534_041240, partial [Acytostelium subglobosum LB1]|uniref:hypothetical protein n=1 Tax=Acytostelium subglobosum LB1 TaxID=1410327 RepID=UPI000644B69D
TIIIIIMTKLILILLMTIVCTMTLVKSETFGGTLQTNDEWYLVGKFCFTSNSPTLTTRIDFSKTPNVTLLLYSDLDTQWGRVQNLGLSCSERVMASSAQISMMNNLNGQTISVDQRRARWWYFAFANCDQPSLTGYQIDIPSYELEFVNDGDSFDARISADVQGIPQAQMFFIVFFFLLLVASVVNIVFLWNRNLETKVMKMFIVVLVFKVLGLFVCLVYWGVFFRDDYATNGLWLGGITLDLVSHAFFMLLLLLVAQGWAISPFYGNRNNKIITTVMFFVILIMSIVVYLVPSVTFMPSKTYVFFYDTPAGYALLAFFLAIMIWFIVLSFASYVKQTDVIKKKFFMYFGLIFTAWFLLLPISVVVAHFLNSWVRQKVVVIFNLAIDGIFFFILTFLFRGAKSNPYVHILELEQKEKGVRMDDKPDSHNQ